MAAETLRLSAAVAGGESGGDEVDGQAGRGDREHQPTIDLRRIAQPDPRLDEDPDRDRHEGDAVE